MGPLQLEVGARDETIDALHRKLEEKAVEVAHQMDAERRLGVAAKQQAVSQSSLEVQTNRFSSKAAASFT